MTSICRLCSYHHMKIMLLTFILVLASCAQKSAIPLGNDMMQIDVSGDIVHTRAQTQKMAFEKAAQATVEAGFDRFIIVDNKGWNEQGSIGSSYGRVDGNIFDIDGRHFGGESTYRLPESTMVIRMIRRGDKGYAKAIEARKHLKDP